MNTTSEGIVDGKAVSDSIGIWLVLLVKIFSELAYWFRKIRKSECTKDGVKIESGDSPVQGAQVEKLNKL